MQRIAENMASADSGDKPEFRKALERAINSQSMENGSDTPDFVLSQYLADCLAAFDRATQHRESWYGRGRSVSIGGESE
jgi:hypothetical protein